MEIWGEMASYRKFRISKTNKILRHTFGKRSVEVYFESYKSCLLEKTEVSGKVRGLEASIVRKADPQTDLQGQCGPQVSPC